MAKSLDRQIRDGLLDDAVTALSTGPVFEHYAHCAVRYSLAIKAVLDECERRGQFIPTASLLDVLARELNADHEEKQADG